MNRRNFIRGIARGGLLGGLLLVPGIFIYRRQVTGDGECSGNFHCSRCGKLSRCTLPEALKERETAKRSST